MHWIKSSYDALNSGFGWMAWNTFLALIPWVLSLWLFRGRSAGVRPVGWWLGLLVFVAFLPNAPYVLTDIIHLIRAIRYGTNMWTVVFVLLPQYFVFMWIGTQAYVLSLINLGQYVRAQGWHRWVLASELGLHALCAVGIYLGRFPRFNSWDLVTNPGGVVSFMATEMLRPQPMAVMALMFLTITLIYWLLKHLSFAVSLYWKSLSHRRSLG